MLETLDRLEPILLGLDAEAALNNERENNEFIGIKTLGARKRIVSELVRRNRAVPEGFWRWYFELPHKEKALASFYLCMKTYRLVFELQFDLALRKFRIGSELRALDVEQFLDLLGGRDAYVGSWSAETMKKLNSQYRQALRDAHLLEGAQLKVANGVRPAFWNYFKDQNEHWFIEACFEN